MFFLFLASVIVLRRIVSEEKLSPVEVSPEIKRSASLPGVTPSAVSSHSVGGDLSQLSSALSQWGEGAAPRKESSLSNDSVKVPAKD